MEHHPTSHSLRAQDATLPDIALRVTTTRSSSDKSRRKSHTGLTLVEVMVSLTLMATVMLGFIGTFVQSRRVTEASVLHAAASSMIYGIVEQIKGQEYSSLLPSTTDDTMPDDPSTILGVAPFVRVRINQDRVVWLRTVYTQLTDSPNTPKGPTTTPAPSASNIGVGADGSDAIDNFLGALPLSTVTGTASQQLSLNVWLWVDELTPTGDVSEVKKVTIIYTYSYMDGGKERVIRDREVFLRTRFDQ